MEDLFNNVEFEKKDSVIQQPYLDITFYNKSGAKSFYIDEHDIIKLRDGSHLKSKQIKFDDLYSIYYKYLSNKKRPIGISN